MAHNNVTYDHNDRAVAKLYYLEEVALEVMSSVVSATLSSARVELLAMPRLPSGGKLKRTPEQQRQDLIEFHGNIGLLFDSISMLAPPVSAGLDDHIRDLIASIRSEDKTIFEGTAMTLAYNQLKPRDQEYWKEQETHRSMVEGLKLLVEKAETPDGYEVHIADFNSIFPTLAEVRDPETLALHVQSLLRLAPNRHDLLEDMVGDKIKDTTGVNCGKTIGAGFNEALKGLMPPESESFKLCSRVNDKLLGEVMDACLALTSTPDALPEDLRRGLIARVLTQIISGGSDDVSKIVPPTTIRLLESTLFQIYTPKAVEAALLAEISALGADMMLGESEALKKLGLLGEEVGIANMYDLLGEDFLIDEIVAVPPALIERLATEGQLLQAAGGGGAPLPVDDDQPPVEIASPSAMTTFPAELTDLIQLNWSVGEDTNLYFDGGTFTSRWTLFDEAANTSAREIIKGGLVSSAQRVLLTYMPPEELETHLAPLREAVGQNNPYTLGHAQEDFRRAQLAVRVAIELHTAEHLRIAKLKSTV